MALLITAAIALTVPPLLFVAALAQGARFDQLVETEAYGQREQLDATSDLTLPTVPLRQHPAH